MKCVVARLVNSGRAEAGLASTRTGHRRGRASAENLGAGRRLALGPEPMNPYPPSAEDCLGDSILAPDMLPRDNMLSLRHTCGVGTYRLILPIAAQQHGLITMADAVAVGATRNSVTLLAQDGVLERVARGVYCVPELAGDPLEQYQEALLRYPGGVLSHDTALDLHDLCDINPAKVHVTLRPGMRFRKEVPAWLSIHRRPLDKRDITVREGLAIVTPARAIIDGIETHIGQRFTDQAIETARRRNLLLARDNEAIELAAVKNRLKELEATHR